MKTEETALEDAWRATIHKVSELQYQITDLYDRLRSERRYIQELEKQLDPNVVAEIRDYLADQHNRAVLGDSTDLTDETPF